MYTEDDEEVTVKEDNSNIKYSDFYTSFNDIEKEDSKDKKGKKKNEVKEEDTEAKEESDFVDFYGDEDTPVETNDSSKKTPFNFNFNINKNVIRVIIIVVLVVILIALIILLFGKKVTVKGDIELAKTSVALNIGDKEHISYSIVDTEKEVTSTFKSSDPNIIIVNDTGEVIAINEGEAEVIVSYTIEGVTREKKYKVKVTNDGKVNQNITLNLRFEKGQNNTWTNGDVVINPEASSIFGITSLGYTVNCDNNCKYDDILNKKITISNNGETKIKVIAKDLKNQEITKEAVVKIDKVAPSASLVGNSNIISTKDVEVCATCSDSLSGCKQTRFCKKFTESKSNQVITVEDKAGNKKNSNSFNVTINKAPSCTLKVSSNGTVTATLKESATYYGFNSSYTGTNTLSKKITINASKAGESGAKIINYYVKTKNGTGSCSITVLKKCVCAKGTSGSNCKVSCTFSSK